MVLVQKGGAKAPYSVNLTKVVVKTANIVKGDQIVFKPIEGNPNEFRMIVVR